ncbi:MAG: phytanoyl-CoA dioxygenase family protein [Pseudomonadales bacterium]|nr:phytanoyl-CoA dioxygenase family protein [Pseudomonadales bacterium]
MNTNTKNEALIISNLDEDQAVLKKRFQEYGYLYFKKAINAQRCQQQLDNFLAVLSPYIGYNPETKTPVLTGSAFGETDAIWDECYPKMQAQESFHSFFHEPEVSSLMQLMVGEQVFAYPMKMARISCPNKLGFETPPHQDAHSHQSGPTMCGIWVALHDIKEGMGRLKMLPGSHKQGVRKVLQADGVGGVQCEIFEHETTWHVSDMQQGDVIIFDSCCIHKAEPNTTDEVCRMSIDTRFCTYGEPVFITNIDPHHGWRIEQLNWETIYQGWKNNDLQYYWKDYPEIFSVMKTG